MLWILSRRKLVERREVSEHYRKSTEIGRGLRFSRTTHRELELWDWAIKGGISRQPVSRTGKPPSGGD